jgi:hypothetical protein
MTLPHEAEVITDIAAKYRSELDAMTGLHDAVVAMMTAGSWTFGRRGVTRPIFLTILGLLTKACKTFRSIQILCERGLIEDADALTRVLMENYVAIVFILQKRSRERVVIYHAYGSAQDIKMLNEWKRTPGLKRKATKEVIKHANDGLSMWTRQLPPSADFKHHWSGKRNLQEAVKALRGDAVYATLYRFTSSTSHASDFASHVEVDQTSGDPVWQIEPRARGFEAPSYAARELLWGAASRIDQRLGLGFSASLAPHRVQKPK